MLKYVEKCVGFFFPPIDDIIFLLSWCFTRRSTAWKHHRSNSGFFYQSIFKEAGSCLFALIFHGKLASTRHFLLKTGASASSLHITLVEHHRSASDCSLLSTDAGKLVHVSIHSSGWQEIKNINEYASLLLFSPLSGYQSTRQRGSNVAVISGNSGAQWLLAAPVKDWPMSLWLLWVKARLPGAPEWIPF